MQNTMKNELDVIPTPMNTVRSLELNRILEQTDAQGE